VFKLASVNAVSQPVSLHVSRPITFRPFRDLIVRCPVCAERHKKQLVTRPTINSWGCCASCGWRLRPGPAPKTADDLRADVNATNTIASQSITPDKSVVNQPTVEAISTTQDKPYGQLGMRLRKDERKKFTNGKVTD